MELLNLVSADFRRIKKDKSLRTILIINVVIIILLTLLFLLLRNVSLRVINGEFDGVEGMQELKDQLEAEGIDLEMLKVMLNAQMAYTSYQVTLSTITFGLLLTVAVAIFVGSEFSFNTIRNKLVSGNSRTKVYISTYISALIIGLIFYCVALITQFIITTLCFGFVSANGLLIKTALLTILPYASLIALTCLISVTTKSRSLGITLNILVLILLPTIMELLLSVVANSEVAINIMSVVPHNILSDLLAYNVEMDEIGRLIKMDGINNTLVLRALIAPPLFAAFFVALGAVIFKRMDIK